MSLILAFPLCQILVGEMIFWQNGLSSWSGWVEYPSQPNPVRKVMVHPVVEFYVLSQSPPNKQDIRPNKLHTAELRDESDQRGGRRRLVRLCGAALAKLLGRIV